MVNKSVNSFDILKSSLRDINSNSFLYLLLLAPMYVLTGIAFTFDDFIIVNNTDFELYNYSTKSYLIGFSYIVIECYVFAIIAVAIHNKIIKKSLKFKFFSNAITIYFLTYMLLYMDFITHFLLNNLVSQFAGLLILAIYLFAIIIWITAFLWILYLPNISINDKHSLIYIIKNSFGARLTVIIQGIYLTIFISAIAMILVFIGGLKLAYILIIPFWTVLGVTMLSNTYLAWKELERNTNSNN